MVCLCYDQESMIKKKKKKASEDEIVESASHSKILTEPRSERNEEGRAIVSGKTLVEMRCPELLEIFTDVCGVRS